MLKTEYCSGGAMIELVQFARLYHVEHLAMAAVGVVFLVVALVDQARLRHHRRRADGPRTAAALLAAAPAGGAADVGAQASDRSANAYGRPIRRATRQTRLRHLTALLAIVAGAVHFLVTPEHFAEGLAPGAFMLTAGTAQVAAGVLLLLLRPSRALLAAAVAGTLGILVVYVVSRTTGLPIGPTPWVPERVGMIDLASKVTELEFVAAGVLLMMLDRAPAARPPRRLRATAAGL